MLPLRGWPHQHTNTLLDYIDKYRHTLATAGPRRRKGYARLRKLLNAKCIPRPRPPYSIEDIRAHCSFLSNQYSVFQGPNLTAFFKTGRNYLRQPFGTAGSDVQDAASRTVSVSATDTERSETSPQGIVSPSQHPQPQDSDRVAPSPPRSNTLVPCECSATSLKPEEHTPPRQRIQKTSEEWQALFYLRSKNHRIPQEDIEPAMVRLGRNAYKAAESYLKNSHISRLPRPDIDYIKQHHQSLGALLESVVHEKNMVAFLAGKISNVLLLRSLISWAVYRWVFQDPFPVLGTESGGIWDDLQEMLKERGKC
jgi:hypothetical protein